MPGETVKRSVGGNYTVAGDLGCERVDAERSADGLCRSATDLPRNPSISRDLPARNMRGRRIDFHLKGGGLMVGFHVGYFITRRYGSVMAHGAEFDCCCISNRHRRRNRA